MNAQEIFDALFSGSMPREARSTEYRQGVFCALRYRLQEIQRMQCPYPIGTAQADAWFSGADEGHSAAREWANIQNAA